MYQTLHLKVGLVLVGEPGEDTDNDLYTKCCEEGEYDQYLGIIEKEKLSQPNSETLNRCSLVSYHATKILLTSIIFFFL